MTVRLGFLGAGFIADHHAGMLALSGADAVVAAVFDPDPDPDPDRAAAFASRYSSVAVSSETELFDASDAVYVCTWTSEHPRLVAEAARRALPVFRDDQYLPVRGRGWCAPGVRHRRISAPGVGLARRARTTQPAPDQGFTPAGATLPHRRRFRPGVLVAKLRCRGVALRFSDAGFVEAVASGAAATPGVVDALRARVVADAAYRSAADGGRWLDIPAGVPLRL